MMRFAYLFLLFFLCSQPKRQTHWGVCRNSASEPARNKHYPQLFAAHPPWMIPLVLPFSPLFKENLFQERIHYLENTEEENNGYVVFTWNGWWWEGRRYSACFWTDISRRRERYSLRPPPRIFASWVSSNMRKCATGRIWGSPFLIFNFINLMIPSEFTLFLWTERIREGT